MTEEWFKRRPPTQEDEYFREQEWQAIHGLRAVRLVNRRELVEHERKLQVVNDDSDEAERQPPRLSLWSRIARALSSRADTDWRP